MILFIQHSRKGKTKDRKQIKKKKQISSCQGLGAGERKVGIFRGDSNVLHLDYGSGYMTG